MERTCEHCSAQFEVKRKDVVYCSASCRQMAYINRKSNNFPEQNNTIDILEFQDAEYNKQEKEQAKQTIMEAYSNQESKYISTLDKLFDERDNVSNLSLCFFIQKNQSAFWVSLRLRCLVECLLLFSEMRSVEMDDLKELCNAFIKTTKSAHFAHLPQNYPYTNYINSLKSKLKQICFTHEDQEIINLNFCKETKMELILTRFELTHFVQKISFSELQFD